MTYILIDKIRILQKTILDYPGKCLEKLAKYIDFNCSENEKICIKKISEILSCKQETISRNLAKLHENSVICKNRNIIKKIDRKKLKKLYKI